METDKNIAEKENSDTSYYFSVTSAKLAIMSLCTFNIYILYWFYKNWQHVRHISKKDLSPFWRAFFAPLWSYSIFRHLQEKVDQEKLGISLYAGSFAFLYFIINALARLPDPYWLVTYTAFFTVMPANSAVSLINKSQSNECMPGRIRGWNWLAIVLGGLLFVFAILGTFMPTEKHGNKVITPVSFSN